VCRGPQRPYPRPSARRDWDGEPIVLLWERPAAGDGTEAVSDILRVESQDGAITRLRWYYFCPETLAEVTIRLGLPVRPHGHHPA
jgi:RNA polymerase sigma-70 factor, ECF subfamily